MIRARMRKTGSSFCWYFSAIALTDSASILAWAGSYTPQGRSQCAWAAVRGLSSRVSRIGEPPGRAFIVISRPATLPLVGGPHSSRWREVGARRRGGATIGSRCPHGATIRGDGSGCGRVGAPAAAALAVPARGGGRAVNGAGAPARRRGPGPPRRPGATGRRGGGPLSRPPGPADRQAGGPALRG